MFENYFNCITSIEKTLQDKENFFRKLPVLDLRLPDRLVAVKPIFGFDFLLFFLAIVDAND